VVQQTDIIYLGRSRLHRTRANLVQLLHTASGFTRLGFRTSVVLPPWPRRLSVPSRLAELGVDPCPELHASQLLHPRWRFWPYVWVHRRALGKARVIYTRVAHISLALAHAGLQHHLEIHDVDALTAGGTIDRIIELHRTGLIGYLVPISAGAAGLLMEAGADPARIHVAHSGVKLEAYADLAPFDPGTLVHPRIVHLGRLSGPRGLEVFRHFAMRGDCDITVISTDENPIENVSYHAPIPMSQVPGWYARSDLTLLPYQADIATVATMSPIKMFEAMAAGRPIIASDLPTMREVLKHEETALLVKPDDLNAWDQAYERLRDDPELASRLACNAQAEAAGYSWDARARGIADAIGLSG